MRPILAAHGGHRASIAEEPGYDGPRKHDLPRLPRRRPRRHPRHRARLRAPGHPAEAGRVLPHRQQGPRLRLPGLRLPRQDRPSAGRQLRAGPEGHRLGDDAQGRRRGILRWQDAGGTAGARRFRPGVPGPADDAGAVRSAARGTFRAIDWDEAYAIAARELQRACRRTRSPSTPPGRSSNEAAFLWQLAARGYGSANLPDSSNFCHEPSRLRAEGKHRHRQGHLHAGGFRDTPSCSSSSARTPPATTRA